MKYHTLPINSLGYGSLKKQRKLLHVDQPQCEYDLNRFGKI